MDFKYVCENSSKVDKILSVDMKREDFYPLNIFVNNQIEKIWVEQLKVDQIRRLEVTKNSASSSSWPRTNATRSTT